MTTIHTPTGPINVRRYRASIPSDFFIVVRFNIPDDLDHVTSITRRLPSEIRGRSDVTKDVVQAAVSGVLAEFGNRMESGWTVRSVEVREESTVWWTPPVRDDRRTA